MMSALQLDDEMPTSDTIIKELSNKRTVAGLSVIGWVALVREPLKH